MPDYPPAIYRIAAEAVERELMSGTGYGTHTDSDEAIARAVLDAIAADLGNAVAEKILRHADEHEPKPGSPTCLAWHRHFGTAARVAALAFLTEDDKRAMAARELAAGNYVSCDPPEDGTREH